MNNSVWLVTSLRGTVNPAIRETDAKGLLETLCEYSSPHDRKYAHLYFLDPCIFVGKYNSSITLNLPVLGLTFLGCACGDLFFSINSIGMTCYHHIETAS